MKDWLKRNGNELLGYIFLIAFVVVVAWISDHSDRSDWNDRAEEGNYGYCYPTGGWDC